MKSLCIKTNNSILIRYLLNELEHLELEDICFSVQEFKHFKNLIIHYNENTSWIFLDKISSILSLLVIDELEEDFINKLLVQNYFYFNLNERNTIINICFDIMSDDFPISFNTKFQILHDSFYNFLLNNRKLFLKGFINFRLKDYFDVLDSVITEAVNTFVIEKEYLEFISLLKLYINSQKSNCETVHIIYSNSNTILLDEDKQIINISQDNLKTKYLSDISFSSNDYTLNSLLSLLPKKIYVHLINNQIDEFINTLQAIFENRLFICTDCCICKLYKNATMGKNPNTV